ncbi:hypothetical protein D3C73_1113620 [compost metagenome]
MPCVPVNILDQGTSTEGYRLSPEGLTCTNTALKPVFCSLSSNVLNSCFCLASLPAEEVEGQSRLNTVEIQAPFISFGAFAPGTDGTVGTGTVGVGTFGVGTLGVGTGVGFGTLVGAGTAGADGPTISVFEYSAMCLVA